MLKLTNVKPEYFIEDIDDLFESLSVSDNYSVVKKISELNGCSMITPEQDIDSRTKIVDLRMRHPLFGSLGLDKLPSGYKALCIASIQTA